MYKVMIAEDKPLIRKGIINMIQWETLCCSLTGEAENGQDAIRMIRASCPDILLTDIKMPRIDGLKLLDFIEEQKLPTKVIVISGYDNFEYAKRAIQSHCVDYILKPIHEDELNRAIANACAQLRTERASIAGEDGHSVRSQRLLSAIKLNRDMTFNTLFPDSSEADAFLLCIISNKYNDYDTISEKIVSHLPTCVEALCVDSQEHLNIAFRLSDPDDLPYVRTALLHLPSLLDEYLGNRLHTGICQIHGCFSTVFEAYYEAEEALCAKLVEPSRYLFEYAHSTSPSMSFAAISQSEPIILDFLLSGNGPQAFALCSRILEESLSDGNGIRSYCTILTQFYYTLLKTDTLYAPEIQEEIKRCSQPDSLLLLDSTEQLTSALSHLYNLVASEIISNRNSHSSLAKDVKTYIDSHYMHHLSLSSLGNLFHVNASYLSVLFKKENGIGISKYIRTARLEYAKQLLSTTDFKLIDIGEKVGFPNYVHFSKIFKAYTRLSPSEYRKMYGSEK